MAKPVQQEGPHYTQMGVPTSLFYEHEKSTSDGHKQLALGGFIMHRTNMREQCYGAMYCADNISLSVVNRCGSSVCLTRRTCTLFFSVGDTAAARTNNAWHQHRTEMLCEIILHTRCAAFGCQRLLCLCTSPGHSALFFKFDGNHRRSADL